MPKQFAAVSAALAIVFAIGSAARVRADVTTVVGAAQLEHADGDANSWLTYGRDLSAHRFSPLAKVDASNVNGLSVVWKKTLGPPVSTESTPIVSNGTMYVTTGNATVWAVDAVTGATKWTYKYPLPVASLARACCDTDNRGVTLTNGKVIFGTLDAHLVALDAKTGKVQWNATVAPNTQAYSITSPPLPVKNTVITGVGGGEYPTRGFIAAYDVSNGKALWKRYTIPGPGELGYETWKVHGVAARGGGPTWLPGTYDPQRNTVYWGVGNPNPDWDSNSLKGSLLYTSSVLALDADTGKIKWYYQFTPHDIWDFDSVNEPVLVDVPIGGKTVAALAHADRNGYLYVLDRETGKLIYTVPFLDKINWGSVGRTTGKITFNASIQNAADGRKPYTLYPAVIGGKNWEPTAYDPTKHLFFIPAIESSIKILPLPKSDMHPKAAVFNGGAGFTAAKLSGSVSAWDLTTGKMVWKRRFALPELGGALATAGGLVFAGQMDGHLVAMDESTGKVVWQGKTASGIIAPPITFAVRDKQYVAIASSVGGVVAKFFMASTPTLQAVPKGSMMYVFGLGSKSARAATRPAKTAAR